MYLNINKNMSLINFEILHKVIGRKTDNWLHNYTQKVMKSNNT